LKTKIKKVKNFFIPYHTSTYGENPVYIFVDFRIKRAGCSNYGGGFFAFVKKQQVKRQKGKVKTAETAFVIPAQAGIHFQL
jgi:hypothetical protein